MHWSILINRVLAGAACLLTMYSAYIVSRDIVSAFANLSAVSQGGDQVWTKIIAFTATLVPVSLGIIAYSFFRNRPTMFLLFPMIHAWLFFISLYLTIFVLTATSWIIVNKVHSKKTLRSDSLTPT